VCERVCFRDFETKGVDLSSPGGTLPEWEGNGNEGNAPVPISVLRTIPGN